MYPTMDQDSQMQLLAPSFILSQNQIAQASLDLPKLIGDERRLRQVLMNLVKNALKFSNVAGTVTIKACYSGSHLIVNVTDTGVGIEREDFPKLFSRFGKL